MRSSDAIFDAWKSAQVELCRQENLKHRNGENVRTKKRRGRKQTNTAIGTNEEGLQTVTYLPGHENEELIATIVTIDNGKAVRRQYIHPHPLQGLIATIDNGVEVRRQYTYPHRLDGKAYVLNATTRMFVEEAQPQVP